MNTYAEIVLIAITWILVVIILFLTYMMIMAMQPQRKNVTINIASFFSPPQRKQATFEDILKAQKILKNEPSRSGTDALDIELDRLLHNLFTNHKVKHSHPPDSKL